MLSNPPERSAMAFVFCIRDSPEWFFNWLDPIDPEPLPGSSAIWAIPAGGMAARDDQKNPPSPFIYLRGGQELRVE
jgi:hypothetical protein